MAILQAIAYAVTIGGRVVDPSLIRWRRDEAEYLIDIELQLPDEGEWLQCALGEEIRITVTDIVDLTGVVESLPWSAGPDGPSWIVRGVSPAMVLDDETIASEDFSGIADEIAAELVSRYGLSLTWSLPDGWPVRTGSLVATHETPLSVLRKLAESAGGVIQSMPAGALTIRPEYPVAVPGWPSATPDLIISDQDFAISATGDLVRNTRYNAFLIGDQGTSGSGVTIDEGEQLSPTQREIFVYVVPWLDRSTLTFTQTGGAWVTIESMGEVEQTITDEEIEIVGGAGSLSKPCHAIISTDYREVSLGAITAAEDGSITTEIDGESLVQITYTTRYLSYILTNPNPDTVQVVVDEAI